VKLKPLRASNLREKPENHGNSSATPDCKDYSDAPNTTDYLEIGLDFRLEGG
jgi:hypothetical protein